MSTSVEQNTMITSCADAGQSTAIMMGAAAVTYDKRSNPFGTAKPFMMGEVSHNPNLVHSVHMQLHPLVLGLTTEQRRYMDTLMKAPERVAGGSPHTLTVASAMFA
jgi:hypothetical protein